MSAMSARVLAGLTRVDTMTADMRHCVHEYGLPIVEACLQAGVRQPNKIHQLVREIWTGTRQTWMQHQRGYNGLVSRIECILARQEGPINAATLLRILDQNDFVLVPRSPWACMIEASMNTVSNFNQVLTKREKHTRRLQAAINAAVEYAWPHLGR